jgi:hypothetical protein
MGMGRPKAELVLSAKELAHLQSFARSRSLPAALVRRVKIVLACCRRRDQHRGGATFRDHQRHRGQVAPALRRSRGSGRPQSSPLRAHSRQPADLGLDREPALATAIAPLLMAQAILRKSFTELHCQVLAVTRIDPVSRRLMTVPGIGPSRG